MEEADEVRLRLGRIEVAIGPGGQRSRPRAAVAAKNDDDQPRPPRAERALHYHRPFLEDGAIEYEFYYEPEKAHVHPMLDRVTFLLEPDGVRLHWLTDGQYDRSGIKADNVHDEPANRRGPEKPPLKEKAWNRVKVAVAGDSVTVSVNGVEVYQRPIESTNLRTFGLFHYADRTEARVRNVTYRGDWPKQFPGTAELLSAGLNGRK